MKRKIILSCPNLLLLSQALVIISFSDFASASLEEANALLIWKASLQIPNNSPLSSWDSPFMNSTDSPWSGVVLNDDGTIQKLYLPYFGLNGTLNQFPFSFLNNLSRLELSTNYFFGPVPAQIRLLSKLVYLDLSSNMFSGIIPPEIGMLANLETLHLFENQLNGSIPQEIGQLTSLSELTLSDNSLEGELPPPLGNLRKLAYLYLNDNMLSGQIPHEFGQLVNLVELSIGNNSLNGNIPPTIRNLKSLEYLSLHDNKLSGHVPQGVLTSLNLLEIEMDNNQLAGPLPEDLCHGGRLQYLSLSYNQLTGPIPIGLKNCSSLTRAYFDFNQFTGDISNSFGVYPSLGYLDVSHNNFHGNLSQNWSNKCKNLTVLGMGYNNISGYIPPEFGNSTQLQMLDLSSNHLVGEIPKEFGNMKGMIYLLLKDNQLSGVIPQELGSLYNMEYFDLSKNKLNGLIPKYIGVWKQIKYLNLSNNKLNGQIPSEVGKLSNLTILDFSWNSLTGEIPSAIQTLVNLASLNLSHNRLSGSIPNAFGKLPSGIDINLSYNDLVGPVPTSFAIFMNSSTQVFQGNLDLCGNVTGLKLCESQILVNKHKNIFHQRLVFVIMFPFFGAILLGLLIWKFRWRKKAKYNVNAEIFLNNNEFLALKRYSYSQVKKITNSFEVKLGQGGFGSVYKGSLSNGNLVAVKVLSESKGNGDDFINEIASVSRTSHVNIVSLVGFCLEGRRSALIYEFMPNGSLEKFIYGRDSSSISQLGWKKLQQIAIGIARGLEYLHRGCNTRILHFDIKPHNILLDQDFCPKISDFGLAKQLLEKRSMISLSCMRGTPGYIAPELISRNFGPVSHKSDVYSYGMMILEMVVGGRNVKNDVDHTSEIYFPDWIYKKVESEEKHLGLHGIVSNEENELARKMIIVGLWCVQTNPLNRPAITKVLEMLEGGLELLEMPPKPCMFSPQRSGDLSTTD